MAAGDPTPAGIDPAALGRIETKLDRLLSIQEAEAATVGPDEAMAITGAKSKTALYRLLSQLNVRPFARGKFRRLDLTNAVTSRAILGR